MAEATAEVLDLRDEVCPYTFVKSKLRIEDMAAGEELLILLDDSAATANVSRSLKSEGHEIHSPQICWRSPAK